LVWLAEFSLADKQMRRLHFTNTQVLVLVVLALLFSGCRKQSGIVETKKPSGNINGTGRLAENRATPSTGGAASADHGDFKLEYEPRKTPKKSDEAHRVGENEQAIAGIIADLNKKVALPFDIYLSISSCDQPDAYYDPEMRTVVVCHQLIDEYYDLFARKVKDKAKLDEAVKGATAATFFHELGHALVDAWKLPITGKEEDAVDQLSTLVLINRTDAGEQMAIAGAVSFRLYADLSKGEKKIYWDEHSLDDQRFYDTVCMIYGHNPQRYEYLIKEGVLPEERAVNCQADYERIERSWRTLLAPYLK
jgi:hypothetical protein